VKKLESKSGYRHRYEIAEEIIRRGGRDEDIQQAILAIFPNSKENPTRAAWYRRSFRKYGHCRGEVRGSNSNSRSAQFDERVEDYDLDAEIERLEKACATRSDLYVKKLVNRTIRNDRKLIAAIKERHSHRCQFPGCSAEIRTADGGLYVEVAHLHAVASGGTATRVNLVVLCPNHHKMIDLGQCDIEVATFEEVVFRLNGSRFRIRH